MLVNKDVNFWMYELEDRNFMQLLNRANGRWEEDEKINYDIDNIDPDTIEIRNQSCRLINARQARARRIREKQHPLSVKH